MTTTIAAAPSSAQAASAPTVAVVLRNSSKPSFPPGAVDLSTGSSVTIEGVVRSKLQREILAVASENSPNNRTSSPKLKTLSNDLSEILVKNLSLKRGENCTEESPTNSNPNHTNPTSTNPTAVVAQREIVVVGESDNLNLIQRKSSINNNNNRNSLCDTFSSVNKLIKLKRVSSDSSSISGSSYAKVIGSSEQQLHSINPPPQAKFKRVEISVQKLPAEESGAGARARRNIIVNQIDELVPFYSDEEESSESIPLLIAKKSKVQSVTTAVGDNSLSSSDTNSVRRRIHSVATVKNRLERAEEEKRKRRSLQWPLGLGSGAGDWALDWGDFKRPGGRPASSTILEETTVDGDFDEEHAGEERNLRKSQFRHSWNAPGYDLLPLDGEREPNSKKDFASLVHNLAGLKSALANGGTHESASLLESPQFSMPRAAVVSGAGAGAGGGGGGGGGGAGGQGGRRGTIGRVSSSPVVPASDGSNPVSLGGPVPRKRRLEAFLKSLVGRRPSKEPPAPVPHPAPHQNANMPIVPPLLPSPEIKISKSPSEHNLVEMTRSRLNISTTSLSSVHQKLWSVVPLLKKDVSCNSLAPPKSVPLLEPQPSRGMRKCETVLALTNTTQSVEPIKAQNRLRNCASVATCSRCSSLLSLAAAGSRYSLNLSSGGFVAVGSESNAASGQPPPGGGSNQCKRVGNLLRLTKTSSGTSSSYSSPSDSSSSPSASSNGSCSSSSSSSESNNSSRASVTSKAAMLAGPESPTNVVDGPRLSLPIAAALNDIQLKFTCKLCLGELGTDNLTRISQCGCSFCTECMTAYVEFEISEGAYEVSCPDAMCPAQGIISITEITALASASLVEKHHRYRLNREVELDKFRTWCPKAGCETICMVGQNQQSQQQLSNSPSTQNNNNTASSDRIVPLQSSSSSNLPSPCAVHCPTCREDFCSGCKKTWHPTMSCEENTRRLAADGQTDGHGIPFDNDLIKCCPMCAVPIEKDEGCAQMMCKRCKHVFCWYCLASLDDDFLLRHYDKGPCKNKLGHSRASVVWHRAQVIGIFAGFGILLLVASPLLLLAAPCIVCCKCRICSGAAKLEETEAMDYDDAAVALQSHR
ncbi:uncharacterized protein LOC129756032 [Uranotaenia lowii]|uniref:uncharacterized protein LOC129756032 n=1 Tax=Uranotaenia lowii TaxID=190385 RepID=UPI00247989C1|nr:uncharacterized protein LOC129756032 [Uranotaenia lowii]